MSTNGGASPSVTKKKKKGSMYSLASSARRARPMMKEEVIGKKINDLFKEKEQRMIRTIEQAMYEDNHSVYTSFRKDYAEKIEELEKERGKILRRKKNKKEKMKMLHENSYQRLFYISNAVNNTVKYYKKLYFENDYYRQKCVIEINEHATNTQEKKDQAKLEQMSSFYDSPFKEDRRFAIIFIAQMTRDLLTEARPIVNQLFFDKIFDLLLTTDDERNKLKAFEILSNLIHSHEQREKLSQDQYLMKVYDVFSDPKKADNRTLEKISWMTTLICFYPDMIDQILRLNLLQFIIKISGHQYPSAIRSNAVLALSLLTYHEKMFDELIKRGVIDLVMELCKDNSGDIQVKQFSTLALVHFALNKQSINILIQKGVMDLFNSFGSIDNGVIQTNVSWIFLALCNNGITGKTMVENGITRDMFLVSCNPQFNQIRHLVIAGFAELGRCTELKDPEERQISAELQKIKETAIVGMHQNFTLQAEKTIQILLRFTVSESELYKVISFWALKDYILLNHENLISDINGVIQAFVNGSIYSQEEVNTECANAISFLITHHLVYSDSHPFNENDTSNFVLDALMHLTGSTSMFIRTRAFSTLSTLSTYCSSSGSVMDQIFRDIKLPSNKVSKLYYEFIMQRLQSGVSSFTKAYFTEQIEENYAGLFCLLRIAKDPSHEVIVDAAEKMFEFIFLKDESERDLLNETFFIYVFHALKHTNDTDILLKILKIIRYYIRYNSPLQKEVINPDTILWLLEILEEHKGSKILGCKAAVTLLQIVSEHQIAFDYQEVAIIKKFNQALQNLDVFEKHSVYQKGHQKPPEIEVMMQSMLTKNKHPTEIYLRIEDDAQPISSVKALEQQEEQEASEVPLGEIKQNSLVEGDESMSIGSKQSEQHNAAGGDLQHIIVDGEHKSMSHKSSKISEKSSVVESYKQVEEVVLDEGIKKSVSQSNESVLHTDPDESVKSVSQKDPSHLSEPAHQNISGGGSKVLDMDHHNKSSILNKTLNQSNMMLDDGGTKHQKTLTPSHKQNDSRFSYEDSKIRQEREIKAMQLGNSETDQGESQPVFKGFTQVQTLKDALISSKQRCAQANVRKINNAFINYVFTNIRQIPEEKKKLRLHEDQDSNFIVDSNDDKVVQQILRESLIKSFMVIFTHDHSQHLLLNRDLIDIAFNVLEFCDEIAEEAQLKLAKLISIIFKFPQVQKYILKYEIVMGVTHLLQVQGHYGILSYAVKACTYLTMDYEFVNQPLSLELLKKLIPLIDIFWNHPQKDSDQDKHQKNIINLIFSITNIVKGSNANKTYFFELGGTTQFLSFIIEQNDFKFIDLCMQTIKEIATSKVILKGMLDKDGIGENLLLQVFQKCLTLTDLWAQNSGYSGMMAGAPGASPTYAMRRRRSSTADLHHNKNSSDMNIMETLVEEDEDQKKSILFASKQILIRTNTYYVMARCIKMGFSISKAQDECRMVTRMVADLWKNKDNWILFDNMLLALNSMELDPEVSTQILVQNYPQLFKILQDYPHQDHKIALLKVLVNLALKSIGPLCTTAEGLNLFSHLFKLIDQNKTDEDMQENIMWLVNAMVDQGDTQGVVQMCLQNGVVAIIAEQISAEKKEATLLQTLLTLTALSKEAELLEQFKECNIFKKLQAITTTHYFSRNLELKTALYQLLEVVSAHNPHICDQLMETGFIGIIFRELNNNRYLVERADYGEALMDIDLSEGEEGFSNDEDPDNYDKPQSSLMISLKNITEQPELYGISKQYNEEHHIDMLDRQPNSNEMIQAILQTIANICQATRSNHVKLIEMGLIDLTKTLLLNYCPYGYLTGVRQETEQIDVTIFTIGNVKCLQSISQVIQCVTKNVDVQELALQNDIVSVIKHCNRLQEYEVFTNLFLSIGNLMLSPVDHVRRRAVELSLLEMLLETNENSEYLRIRRICNSVLQQTDPQLFEYNDALRGNGGTGLD